MKEVRVLLHLFTRKREKEREREREREGGMGRRVMEEWLFKY